MGRPGTILFVLDGRKAHAREGEMLLDAARGAGASIPSLCHVGGIRPYSACRLCLVEVDDGRSRRIVTSCDYPVRGGERVSTTGAKLERLRRSVIRLHLARAPASAEVRAIARSLGVTAGGLRVDDPDERCILCGLCARVCSEIVGAHAVGMAGRGSRKRAALPFEEDDASECIGCGACAWVCPTRCISIEPIAIGRLRASFGEERPCRHALLGLAPGALCAHDYDCASCPFDHEMIERAGGRHPAFLLSRRKG
jgi:bidirectional [NiFe] hydrogenase diaphorase subunit